MYQKFEEKRYLCWKCGHELELETKVSRRDDCPSCGSDLHCCKNCRFYDPSYHNECRENVAYYIRDREKANFCMAFQFKVADEEADQGADDARAKLEAMFKNLK